MTSQNIRSLFAVSEIEILYRSKVKARDRVKITSSQNAYDVLMKVWDANKIELVEQFYILLLDRANACMGISNVSTGGISSCLADPKIIFATALKGRASGLILAHNHPSGNLQPSQADIDLTAKLKQGGILLDLKVLDHLIVTPEAYYSFAHDELHF